MGRADFSTRPAVRSRRWRDGGLLLLGALLLALAAFLALRSRNALAGVREEIVTSRASLSRAEERHRTQIPEALLSAVGSRVLLALEAPPQDVVADIASLLPPDVRLESLTLAYGEGGERLGVDMKIVARDPASYDRFLERLRGYPRFGTLQPGEESLGPTGLAISLHVDYGRLP